MLKSVRIDAGLGDPPREYTNNDAEAANLMIKCALGFNPKEACEFIEEVRNAIESQFRNEDRAVISRGVFRISEGFRHLAVSDAEWSKMSHAERQAEILKFSKTSMSDRKSILEDVTQVVSPETTTVAKRLSVDASESGITTIPMNILEKMFEKAHELLEHEGFVVPQPGATNGSFIVAGYRNKIYAVTPGEDGSIACDKSCIHRSTRICEHVLAVAEKRSSLKEFLAWYRCSNKGSSFAEMATSAAPANTDKKPNGKKRTRKRKKTVEEIADIFEDTPHDHNSGGTTVNKNNDQQQLMREPEHRRSSEETKKESTNAILNPAGVQCAPPVTFQTSHGPTMIAIQDYHVQPLQVPLRNIISSMFYLKSLLRTKVKTCYGCNGQLANPFISMPDDYVIVHRDVRTFRRTGQLVKTTKPQNLHFHLRIMCIRNIYPNFSPRHHLFIHKEFIPILHPHHFRRLAIEFSWSP